MGFVVRGLYTGDLEDFAKISGCYSTINASRPMETCKSTNSDFQTLHASKPSNHFLITFPFAGSIFGNQPPYVQLSVRYVISLRYVISVRYVITISVRYVITIVCKVRYYHWCKVRYYHWCKVRYYH